MFVVADLDSLQADGVLNAEQSQELAARARATMVTLAVNVLLAGGILAATLGLIFWLEDALAVAVVGVVMFVAGLALLARGPAVYRMIGNAAALVGAGMLMGGAALELISKYETSAGWVMTFGGALVMAIAAWRLMTGGWAARFVLGAILLMGVAMHLGGLGWLLSQYHLFGWPRAVFYVYATAVLVGAGWSSNARLVTALAIVPFAQALDTGTFYYTAAYVFYSPESTLSILQMVALIVAAVWLARSSAERQARHWRILAMMGFVVANMCALVGSLWGDYVGETVWGPGRWTQFNAGGNYDEWRAAVDAFIESALYIPDAVYSILWAVALAAMVAWAAHRNQRGLFNAALTFAAIHAYTQAFESFFDQPVAYVIGGVGAIALAWGMWRLNHWFMARGGQAG